MTDYDPRPDFERRDAMAAASDPGFQGTRPDYIRRGQPYFTPLDMAAAVVMVVMIWGPLAAGAFRA